MVGKPAPSGGFASLANEKSPIDTNGPPIERRSQEISDHSQRGQAKSGPKLGSGHPCRHSMADDANYS